MPEKLDICIAIGSRRRERQQKRNKIKITITILKVMPYRKINSSMILKHV